MRTRNGILNGPCSAEDNINHIRMVSLFLHLGALRNSENFLLSRSPSGNSDGLIRVDFISTKIRSEARGVSRCVSSDQNIIMIWCMFSHVKRTVRADMQIRKWIQTVNNHNLMEAKAPPQLRPKRYCFWSLEERSSWR